jgi:hypothetical protein
MKEYKPKLHRIYLEVAAVAVVIAILYYTGKGSPLVLGIFGFGYLIFRIGVALAGICGVRLEDDAIIVRYLIPLKKEKRIDYCDVESYSPIRLPKGPNQKPFMAMLKGRNEKNGILITEQGIHGFDELNAILTDIFPATPSDQGGVRQ